MARKAKQKDPAFMFYPGDFIMGTIFFTNEQVGIYIRLLCTQHQHGGLIDTASFDAMVGDHHVIRTKFVQTDEGYYNSRLMEIMGARSEVSQNMSTAAKLTWEKRKARLLQEQNKSDTIVLLSEYEYEDEINTKKAAGKKFTPPTLEQVIAYFDENGYTAEHATRAFNYYDSAEWTDSKGNAVKNWKQKMQANWFKEEGKKGQGTGKKKKFRIDSPAGSVVKEFTYEELKAFQHSIRNSNGAVTIREEL